MTDALITTLAQIRALRVISRTSVMRFKGARQPLPEIAKALNVDAIVEGTVLRSQGRVRIARAVDSRGVGYAPVGQAVRERRARRPGAAERRRARHRRRNPDSAVATGAIAPGAEPSGRSGRVRGLPEGPPLLVSAKSRRAAQGRRAPAAGDHSRSQLRACACRPGRSPRDAWAGTCSDCRHRPRAFRWPDRPPRRALEIDPDLRRSPRRPWQHGNGFRLGLGDGRAGVSARDRSQASVRPGPHLVFTPAEGHGSHRGVAGREPPRARVRPARSGAEHAHGMASRLFAAVREGH